MCARFLHNIRALRMFGKSIILCKYAICKYLDQNFVWQKGEYLGQLECGPVEPKIISLTIFDWTFYLPDWKLLIDYWPQVGHAQTLAKTILYSLILPEVRTRTSALDVVSSNLCTSFCDYDFLLDFIVIVAPLFCDHGSVVMSMWFFYFVIMILLFCVGVIFQG